MTTNIINDLDTFLRKRIHTFRSVFSVLAETPRVTRKTLSIQPTLMIVNQQVREKWRDIFTVLLCMAHKGFNTFIWKTMRSKRSAERPVKD